MTSISLPCYEGFDAIAIWPEDKSVSNYLIIHEKLSTISFKSTFLVYNFIKSNNMKYLS